MMSSTLRYQALFSLAAIALLILSCGVTYSTLITLAPGKPDGVTPERMELARAVLQERYDQALEGKAW